MCTLLSSIPFDRYSSRTYIYCPGDEHSLRLVRELEGHKSGSLTAHTFLPLPRARKVKQPMMTTVFTSFGTLLVAIVTLFMVPLVKHPLRPPFEVLLVNGPGTCVVVVAVCWIRRVSDIPAYLEGDTVVGWQMSRSRWLEAAF
jgi:beta-1,4-N-acetylglucosaminyltransferase